ncbi:plasmid mobilization protein [Staphylococcus xylosus]|uniref:plasmid mobilization protein n=1 Tax=Staphylococcus xylosus TaxID=1288 RepID=UPI003F5749A6
MANQNHKKAKTININLTEDEYEKVKQLAEIRDLNPTAYTRLTALGNRIKPTVIEMSKEQIVNNEHEEFKKIKLENEELKAQRQYDSERIDLLNSFIKYVNDKGYIDFQGYKNDVNLRENMANYSEEKLGGKSDELY